LLKGCGYMMSFVSVLLLAAVALDGANRDPLLIALVTLGVLTSIGGMALRWLSFERQEKPKSARLMPDHGVLSKPSVPAQFPPRRAPEATARQVSHH
jgi:hypothetical protein